MTAMSEQPPLELDPDLDALAERLRLIGWLLDWEQQRQREVWERVRAEIEREPR